ncbi:type II toxin-antitoxin system RelE/ParE family toxin [Aquimarina agarilytica]|uniref:type II toxin-antitoxin system RelE/ParE family toxin n=1 Tax=Aquimarina agarilytica TaxID=1087449 RepID=UPI0002884D2F|nr:type II toxin-antitoxin system RelE/ParE family toxin [Aquimarina agarilytica]
MARKVIVSKTAQKKLDDLFEYLIDEWSERVKNKFIGKLDKNIELIQANPEIFPKSNKAKGLNRCVITKQITLYFRYNSKRIDIVTVFDTRQNPSKLKKSI